MIRIDNEEVVFQTTLLLNPGQTVVVSTPEACGLTFNLRIGAEGVMPTSADDMERLVTDNEVTFDIPHLPNKYTMRHDHDIHIADRSINVLIAAHGVGEVMVLHMQCKPTQQPAQG